MVSHHIQKSVLDALAVADSLRYSDLKPAELDGNVFTYHLRQLLTQKLVHKSPTGDYSLTQSGKHYIIHRREDRLTQAHSIILFVITCGASVLVRKRLVQPHIGRSGFVHGEPQYDRSIIASAHDRLQQKTGLSLSLTVAHSGTIALYSGGELQSFSHAIVVRGQADTTDLPIIRDETGENCWVEQSELSDDEYLPSCRDLLDLREPFFELRYDE